MKFLKPLPLFSQPLGFYDLDVDPKKILKKIKKTPFQPFAKPHEERTYGHKTVATKNYQLLKKFPDLQNEINKAIDASGLNCDFKFVYRAYMHSS